jgi:hypothetical protein
MHRSWIIVCALLTAAVVMVLAARYAVTETEREIHLTLVFSQKTAVAMINGKEILRHDIDDRATTGSRLGLYMFKSFEAADRESYFRDIRVQTNGSPGYARAFFNGADSEKGFESCRGWIVVPGKGLTLEGKPGTRGVCLIKEIESDEFVLEATILSPIDLGIFFAASDEENGQVLILRPFYNDVFFTFLERGEPGPIQCIGPLKQLTAADEALRLGGLIASLLLRSALFLAILWAAGKTLLGLFRLRESRLTQAFSHTLDSPLLPVFLFALTLLVLGLVARYSLDAVPHIADEAAYLFQAKIFAGGRLWAAAPDFPEFFAAEHIVMQDGRWFAKYPPLFPLLLSLGVLAGFPWMVNPVIGAVSGWLIFLLTTRVTGSRGCGILAWLLLLTSPFFLILNASMMAHATALLLTLLFLYLVCRGLPSNSLPSGLLAGLCMGAFILTRPFTALLVFLPVAVYIIFRELRSREFLGCLKYLSVMGIGILPFLGLTLIRHCLYLPDDDVFSTSFYTAYHSADVLGFGPDKGTGWMLTWGTWGHTLAKGLRSAYNYLSYTSQHLFGWPWRLSFALLSVPLFFGRKKTVCWGLFAIFVFLAVGHMFYWCSQHIGYGARYWFSGVVGLIIPTAYGIMWLRDRLANGTPNKVGTEKTASLFLGLVFLGLTTWNLVAYLPDRLTEGHRFGNVSAGLKEKVEEMDLTHSLIFVKTEGLLYNDGFFLNDPFMNSSVIFARDLGKKNQALIDRHPGYEIYHWDKKELKRISGKPVKHVGDAR